MRDKRATGSDVLVAGIAARQHGVISVAQLTGAGVRRSGVARRVESGRLHRIHRGVYAVGHSGLCDQARWMAAVLACGEGAVLSHRAAAELWALLPARNGPVHVTIPGDTGRRKRSRIHLHRSPSLTDAATTIHKLIATTTPARTIIDLRRVAPAGLVRKATRQAEFLGLDLGEIPTDRTRSDLERDFLRLCRRHRLPTPEVNVELAPYTVDFLWRAERLAVETDGYAAHRGRQAFEDDRERELHLRALGCRVLRFSDVQVARSPAAVAAAVRAELH